MKTERRQFFGLLVFLCLLAGILAMLLPMPFSSDETAPQRQRFDHWQKLDRAGNSINNKHGPWACVLDTRNGLVWENKSNDEGIHHGTWTYSWMDLHSWQRRGSMARNIPEGSCTGLDHCNTAALVAEANRQAWCGYSDWRVPQLQELQSLLDSSYPFPQAQVCPCFLSHTVASSYWSSSSDRYRRQLGLNFGTGEVETFPEHASLYLRLVRGPIHSSPHSQQ